MDNSLYVGMSGTHSSMRQLELITNNLANVNTPGFRADNLAMASHDVKSSNQTRTYAGVGRTFSDFSQGPIFSTDRDLDVALNGPGFIAVQSKTGREGFTRSGDFTLSSTGELKTAGGNYVMGIAGIIRIPSAEKINI